MCVPQTTILVYVSRMQNFNSNTRYRMVNRNFQNNANEMFEISPALNEKVKFKICKKIYRYQGVKEFHMLARIGCYTKVMEL